MPRDPSPVHPRRKDERAYHRAVERRLLRPLLSQLIGPVNRAEEIRKRMLMETEQVFTRFENDVVPEAADELSTSQVMKLNRYHKDRLRKSFKSALGIDVGPRMQDLRIRGVMERKIADNINLITSIPPQFKEQLLNAYDDTLMKHGFDQQELKKTLQNRFKVTNSRAKLITRDQTSKTIGALTKARHEQLGVVGYTWLTAGDERVRESHMALNGTKQVWGIAPSVGHPGEDIQCRCVAIPRFE